MKSWADFLVDPAAIRAIYGEDQPGLDCVDVHEILLNTAGSRVSLRFDLREFPKLPPKKWMLSGFNKVQLELMAVGVRKLSISGWQSLCKLSFDVFMDDGLVHLYAKNECVEIDVVAEHLILAKISAYCDQDCSV